MAVITYFLAVLVATAAVVQAAPWIGGSSVAAPLVTNLLRNQGNSPKVPNEYASSNSQDGVDGLRSGKFYIGVSTIPFSAKEESGFSKLTIPQAVLTLSLFTQGRTGLKLTGRQVAQIWQGRITKWQQIAGSGVTGDITVIVRSDAAGATQIANSYLNAVAPDLFPPRFVAEGPFTYGAPSIKYVEKAGGVANAIKNDPNSLGFVQSGVGKFTYGLEEVAISNKAKKFVTLTGANPASTEQALPRSPPGPSKSWAGVKLVNAAGENTYPIVSLIYFFYKPRYSSAGVAAAVRAFGVWSQGSAAQNLAVGFYFYPLPPKFTSNSLPSLKGIKKG